MSHKKNGKIKIIVVIVGIGITLVGVVMSIAKTYFVLPAEVAHLKEGNNNDHNEFKADIDSCQEWMGETKAELVGIKKDIGFLTEKVDNSAVVQQQILTEIREINK